MLTGNPFLQRPAALRAASPCRPRRGFTLIELILVLAVGSMITLLSFQGMKRDTESNQARIVGQQMQTVGRAVDTYIASRYTPISQLQGAAGGASDPGPRTCSGTTCTITIQTLVSEGLLPVTYQNLNSYGSGYNITLNVTGTAPNWNVVGVVTTAKPWTVGGVTRYDLLGRAMAAAGADSGMSRSSASRIDGYGGVWNAPITISPALGLLGFQVGTGTGLYSVYLRRDGTLPMTGDLNLSDGTNHNIINASNVTGTGRFTSAQTYTNYVNLAGNLDMTGTATIQGSANVNGQVVAQGMIWSANSLQTAGGVSANGEIYSGTTVQTPGTMWAGGNITANGMIWSANSLQTAGGVSANGEIYSGTTVQTPGTMWAGGNITGNYLIPSGSASVGGSCSPSGAIGTDGSQTLFCKNGGWSSAGSATVSAPTVLVSAAAKNQSYCFTMPKAAVVTTSALGTVTTTVDGVVVGFSVGVSGQNSDVEIGTSVTVFAPAGASVCSSSALVTAYGGGPNQIVTKTINGAGFLMVATYLN
ncbi:prepilin-type N-terminal cleavage/methylation domain-containing protein [Paraburkholderia caballeronis]|uniref:Prepilin-type N-terminal cleavage/methylation domain-containing protein n=1 Tax=Paraburkholderia caballeronis TaxID=416943 RepID=A0A1H7N1X8_9BURK|nr:prepilin-type N-terminal cleavage/methylation domain-containing protein [Paraburkholderia caballeronis]PXW26312.1 prepilin-type N-terminal cleavage/methylation domain-containing protein [Paraburkholderia caballeronis]PXX01859.1 prepilin-type N-terminal cleavage/methylation domain-containing protein [Paraburkholderia caballeronis]RAK01016.1 prepilin-type N-terminal cleavage/methylation domain-containing protein [Paraburkholderia caballeronis]SEC02747.1 prepilin-type N-terminal cleavage/methyl